MSEATGEGAWSASVSWTVDCGAQLARASSTITIHVHQVDGAEEAWSQLFAALGTAWADTFAKNAQRVGLPPGVKATLS